MARPALVPRELTVVPFRARDAVARGLISRAMLRGRSWRQLFHDVYVHVDAFRADDHRMWCDAVALLLKEGAAVDGSSAAFLFGVDLLPRGAPVSVSLPQHHRSLTRPGIVSRRTSLPASDMTTFAGIPLTTPVRTAYDLGRRLDRVSGLVALDALCHRRLVSLPQLHGYLAVAAPARGTRRCRDLLALVEPRCESPMETRLRLLLLDAGAPAPVAQHDVRTPHGRFVGRVDLAYPQWRIAIEYEGDHHRERGQFRRDVHRVNELRALGWLVLRFTADDVLRHPDRVLRHIAAAIRERRV